jgi:hypothetical protein
MKEQSSYLLCKKEERFNGVKCIIYYNSTHGKNLCLHLSRSSFSIRAQHGDEGKWEKILRDIFNGNIDFIKKK